MNLTRNGLTFICDTKLKGRKYAVRYKGEKEIHVSPAVYNLLSSEGDTDAHAVAKKLPVREVRRRGLRHSLLNYEGRA